MSLSGIRYIIIKIFIGSILFLLLSVWWINAFLSRENNDTNLLSKLKKIDHQATLQYHQDLSGHTLRYATIGDNTKPTLIFIHGTPGSISDAFPLLEKTDILTRYHVIVPDRPGFGGSMNGAEMPNIRQQSELLSELLFLSGNSEKIILVWWSYAGALLPTIAAQHPNRIKQLVIVAGTMDPEHQTIWKISYPLHYTRLKYLIPNMLRVTNAEKLSSIDQLKTISEDRSKITVPVWLIHGTKDWIVQIENTYFAEKKLINSQKIVVKIIDGVGHEIPITQPQTIMDTLNQLQQ